MTALAKREQDTEVARPLSVLAPLIKKDFESAERAGRSFEKAAGEKLIEAQDGHFDGNSSGFYRWAENKFGKSRTHIRTCIAYAGAGGAKSFKSKKEVQYTSKRDGGLGWVRPASRSWTVPVDAVAERARNEARRLAAEDELTRAQEREAESRLGLRLIDIGFKVLARELHPDRGGSREAMARLNRVRDRLKANV